jgi:hypothetical protein
MGESALPRPAPVPVLVKEVIARFDDGSISPDGGLRGL